jgi:hypothetical protein
MVTPNVKYESAAHEARGEFEIEALGEVGGRIVLDHGSFLDSAR